MLNKYLLFTPGPVNVTETLRTAICEEDKVITDDQMQVLKVGKSVDLKPAPGESIGIEEISAKTGPLLFAELDEMMENREHFQEYYEAAYERLVMQRTVFRALDITGLNWTEIDTAEDYAAANAMFGTPISTISRGQQKAIDEASEKAGTSA